MPFSIKSTLSRLLFGGSSSTRSSGDNLGKVQVAADGSVRTGLWSGISIDTKGRVGTDVGGGMTLRSDGTIDFGYG